MPPPPAHKKTHLAIRSDSVDGLHGLIIGDAHVLGWVVVITSNVDKLDPALAVILTLEHLLQALAHGAVAIIQVLDVPEGRNTPASSVYDSMNMNNYTTACCCLLENDIVCQVARNIGLFSAVLCLQPAAELVLHINSIIAI